MASRMSPAVVDVLVVGGGPGGLHAAERLARAGVSVLVCEEHCDVGSPVHCTGVLAADSFQDFDLPRHTTLNALTTARFVSPAGLTVDYTAPSPLATVIDRAGFDRALAARGAAAPDGFAWVVPVARPEGTYARIGAMASEDAPGCYSRMLARVADRWGVTRDETPPRQKVLPLGEISRTYADRLLVIGDAAGLVKPTTGGGIHYSILSGDLAADVAIDALRRDRLDAATLSRYERNWRLQLADELAAQHALRRVVTRLSDAEVDGLFDLARTDGIMPLVRKTAQLNHHRHLIRALFQHPPARRILFRSLVG